MLSAEKIQELSRKIEWGQQQAEKDKEQLHFDLSSEAHQNINRNPKYWAEIKELQEQTGYSMDVVDRNKARVEKEVALDTADIRSLVRDSPYTGEFLARDGNMGLTTPKDITRLRETESFVKQTAANLAGDKHNISAEEDPFLKNLVEGWEAIEFLFTDQKHPAISRFNPLSSLMSNPITRDAIAGLVQWAGTHLAGSAVVGELVSMFTTEGDPKSQKLWSTQARRGSRVLASVITGEDVTDPSARSMVERLAAGGGELLAEVAIGRVSRVLLGISAVLQGLSITARSQKRLGIYGKSDATAAGTALGGLAVGALEFGPIDLALRGPLSAVKSDMARKAGDLGIGALAEWVSQATIHGLLYLENELLTPERDIEWHGMSAKASIMAAIFGVGQSAAAQIMGSGPLHRDQQRAAQALSDGGTLDELSKLTQEADLPETHEESYRSFLQSMNTEETRIYLDGEEIKEYMQEKTEEEIQGDPGLMKLRKALNERETESEDIAISLTDYLMDIARSSSYTDLRPHARIDPEGNSIYRERKQNQENQEYVDALAEKAEEDAEAAQIVQEVREIEEMLFNQIQAAGISTDKNARSMARLGAARFAGLARGREESPMDLFRRYGLTTEGPQATRQNTAFLNVGLSTEEVGEGEDLDPDQVIERLKAAGAKIVSQTLIRPGQKEERGAEPEGPDTDAEATLIVELKKPLEETVMNQIAEDLQQDAIAQYYAGEGAIFGENQLGFDFDPNEFLMPSGLTAAEERAQEREKEKGFKQEKKEAQRQEDGALEELPRIRGAKPSEDIQQVAQEYMATTDIPYQPPNRYLKVDPDRSARIAELYEEMEHQPDDPQVMAAYNAMIEETIAQYEAILETGLRVEFIPPGKDPYAETPRQATEDIREDNHFWLFPTEEGFGQEGPDASDNPMLRETRFTDVHGTPMVVNDVFRVVHDYFGHAKEGVGFRANGEENAWRIHSSMYSPLARRAMTVETRGQNSWVNYGPYGEQNRKASAEETVFAEQKIGLLPEWVSTLGVEDFPEGAPGEMPVFNAKPLQPYSQTAVGYHYSKKENLPFLDPKKAGTGKRGPDTDKKAAKYGGTHAKVNFYMGTEDFVPRGEDLHKEGFDQLYRVKFTNLYDLREDPLNLIGQFGDRDGQEISQQVLEKVAKAGYDGVIRPPLEGTDAPTITVFDLGEGVEVPVQEVDLQGRPLDQGEQERKFFQRKKNAQQALSEKEQRDFEEAMEGRHISEEEMLETKVWAAGHMEELLEDAPEQMTSAEAYSAAALEGAAKLGWYRRAAEIISVLFGSDAPRFTALLASLSPQVPVKTNLQNTLQVWSAWKELSEEQQQDPDAVLRVIRENATAGRYIPTWEDNAVYALTTDDIENALLSGPKLQSFLENLLGEHYEVTNDVWMAVFNMVDQSIFSGKPTTIEGRQKKVGLKSPGYLAASEKAREAAQKLKDVTGLVFTPAEVQETVWSWTKALYEKKRRIEDPKDLVKIVDQITDSYITDVPDFESLLLGELNAQLTPEQREALENYSPSTDTGLAPEAARKAKEAIDPTGSLTRYNATRVGRYKRSRQRRSALERANERLTLFLAGTRRAGAMETVKQGNISVDTRDKPLRGATQMFEPEGKTKLFKHEHDLEAPNVVQMPDSQEGVQTFISAAKSARKGDPSGPKLFSKEEYSDMKLFLSQDGQAGAAVTDEGEIVSVFGPVSKQPAVLFAALQSGGSWISVLETGPVDQLKDMGFGTLVRTEWDPSQKPRDWKVSEMGKPDTLYMVHKPTKSGKVVDTGTGQTKVPDREAAVDRVQSLLEKRDRFIEANQGREAFKQDIQGEFLPDLKTIRLTEAADVTTWLHEFSHFMLTIEEAENSEIYQAISEWQMNNAEAVAAEAAAAAKAKGILEDATVTSEDVKDYLTTGTTGDPMKDVAIEAGLQERFAKAWEVYISEGRAPSPELRDDFRSLSAQFNEAYQDIRAELGVALDDEIRSIFSKMTAATEQIDEVAKTDQYRPLFTDATMAGMTEEQWQEYQKHQDTQKDEAAETIREKLFKKVKRQKSKERAQERQAIIDDLLPVIEENKVNTARRRLKADLTMDRKQVKQLVGEVSQNKKGAKFVRLPAKLRNMTAKSTKKKPLMDPKGAALVLGYNSGEGMLQDIINSPTARQEAEEQAEATLQERYGDLDDEVSSIVESAMENEAHAHMLLDELKALGRKTGETERKKIHELAKEKVRELSYRQLNPELYRRAETRAAREAQQALDEGNEDAAAKAKQNQLVNHFLAIEAKEARETIEKRVNQLSRYRKESVKTAIREAGGGHWDQIKKILERFEFRKSATLKSVEDQNENLADWRSKRISEYGDALEIAPELLEDNFVTHWKNIPLNRLDGIFETISNIEHVARRASEVIKDGERVEKEQIIQTAVEKLNELPQKWRNNRTDAVKQHETNARKGVRDYIADQTKVPWLVSWMDKGERTGFFHSLFTAQLDKAFYKEHKMLDKYQEKAIKTFEGLSKEVLSKHGKDFEFENLPGPDKTFTGQQIMMAAMYTGSQSGLERLIVGEGWGSYDDPDSLTMENPYLQTVLAPMTKEEWDAVQQIWDIMGEIYPQLKQVYENATGKELGEIQAQEVETPFGTYQGGYFPIQEDKNRKIRENSTTEREEVEQLFTQDSLRQIGVTTGHVETRTKAETPIELNINLTFNYIQDSIHYIAYHDTVRSINRIIRDPRFQQAFIAAFGEEEFRHLKPWLKAVADSGKPSEDRRGWDPALRRTRLGITLGIMGYSVSTTFAQVLGLANAMAEVGVGNMMRSLGWVLKDMATMTSYLETAREKSRIIEYRVQTFDRDLNAAMDRAEKGGTSLKDRVRSTSLAKFIGYAQLYGVDVPTWYAAYIKEMKNSGDEAKAIEYADWVVDNVQGSGRVESMSHVMRSDDEATKMYTLFMTFFSSFWNANRDLIRGTRPSIGTYSLTDASARAMLMVALPAIADMWMRGDLLPEEEETWKEQSVQILSRIALTPVATMPLLRAGASYLLGFEFSLSPLGSFFESNLQLINADEIDENVIQTLFYTAGVYLHIPGTHQIWETGEHIWNVIQKGEDLSFHQLAYGPVEEQSSTPE